MIRSTSIDSRIDTCTTIAHNVSDSTYSLTSVGGVDTRRPIIAELASNWPQQLTPVVRRRPAGCADLWKFRSAMPLFRVQEISPLAVQTFSQWKKSKNSCTNLQVWMATSESSEIRFSYTVLYCVYNSNWSKRGPNMGRPRPLILFGAATGITSKDPTIWLVLITSIGGAHLAD